MIERTTVFSPCRNYRYVLWRQWDEMFNPSYLMQDDPTIRRVIGFAKAWGFGGLCMTNLFAWRDTKPGNMKLAPDPVGPENNRWLLSIYADAGCVLAAWAYRERDKLVSGLIAGMV